MRGQRRQEGTESYLILGGKAAEDVLLGSREAPAQVIEDGPAVVGSDDEAGPAVAGVLAALDQVGLD